MPLDFRTDQRYSHLSRDQVLKHFEEERDLRGSLLAAPREKRAEAFCWAYDELFRRCPWHPALNERSGVDAPDLVDARVKNFTRWLPRAAGTRVLEIGCGMGELVIGLSEKGYQCVGIDVSEVRIQRLQRLQSTNLQFRRVEGTTLPFPDQSFDVAVSMQLFEHLHPEDAGEHLREVFRVLKPGGFYMLETPNALVGPGDVSRFFTETAQGFHLREYTIRDLCDLFHECGFGQIEVLLRWGRLLSANRTAFLEACWGLLPKALRRRYSYGMHNPLYLAHRAET
jgi:SAM-dependent methyltransferase